MIDSPTYKIFKRLITLIEKEDNKSFDFSLNDVHSNNIFSLVVEGVAAGRLTRIFIADKELKPFEVQLHTHRYPINLTVIAGDITHYRANITQVHQYIQGDTITMPLWEYKSPLNGGNGLACLEETEVLIRDSKLPPGSRGLYLGVYDFHTMSVSKGSMWLVEERGFRVDSSKVLGLPFKTNGLYNKCSRTQLDEKRMQVLNELKGIVGNYESVG